MCNISILLNHKNQLKGRAVHMMAINIVSHFLICEVDHDLCTQQNVIKITIVIIILIILGW